MGQKKIKTIDLSKTEKPSKGKKTKTLNKSQKSQKSSIISEKFSDLSVAKKPSKDSQKSDEKKETLKTKSSLKKKKIRSKRYQALKKKVNQKKFYPLNEAVELLLNLANSKIDETVEIHFSTLVKKLTGAVKLPYGTGKKKKIVIADKKIIEQIKQGKINFDVLIASPSMMPQIASVAKILGPKGLMPNPKNGTITDKPEEFKKKLTGGEIHFKTESKNPLLHLTIGKISFGKEKLLKNLEALIKAVEPKNIKKAVLTSTMSPGIKLKVE